MLNDELFSRHKKNISMQAIETGTLVFQELIQLNTRNWCVELTPKQLEMHRSIFSTVATFTLVLKHQTINIYNAYKLFILLDQFHT